MTDIELHAVRVGEILVVVYEAQSVSRLELSTQVKNTERLTPILISLRMRPNIRHPPLPKPIQHRRNIPITRVRRQNLRRRILAQIKHRAVLEIHPAFLLRRAGFLARRERPVDLDDGVVVVLDLRAGLVDLVRDVVAGGDQAEAGVVAGHVGAEAEADVAAAVGDEVADRADVGFCFVHCFVDVVEGVSSHLFVWLLWARYLDRQAGRTRLPGSACGR